MDLELRGKRALVTGSSKGIGETIAKSLAKEGVSILIHGRNAEQANRVAQEIVRDGGSAVVVLGDLGTDAGADAVADAVRSILGSIDILINNVGSSADGSWEEPNPDDWLSSYQTNTLSSVRLIQRLLPQMKAQGWGRFIQIASLAASSPLPDYAAYGAAKAAVVHLSATLAASLAGTGLTANVVSPGIILSDEIRAAILQTADEKAWDGQWPDFERRFIAEFMPNAVGRMGRAEEVADLVTFLASPRANFISGAHYAIDGGRVR